MIRTALLSSMALALSLATVQAAVAAAPSNTPSVTATSLQPRAAKVKQISFDLRNDTSATLTIQAGSSQITLKPGELQHVRIGAGTPLTNVVAASHYAAGSTLTTVSSALSGTTLILG